MWWIVLIALVALTVMIFVCVGVNKEKKDDFSVRRTNYSRQEEKGERGELYARAVLSSIVGDSGKLLKNVLLPVGKNGGKTEADCIIVSSKGIFCIEIKTWVGHICGDDFCEYWTQKYDDGSSDRQHKNPVLQNEKHCDVLAKRLRGLYDVSNIVLLCGEADYSDVISECTFDLSGFKIFYRASVDDKLKNEEVRNIYEYLKAYEATEEELCVFKEQMRNKYGERN